MHLPVLFRNIIEDPFKQACLGNNSWGVKQNFASKRQVFSVGGMGLGKTKQGLKKIVDKAIQKMEKGASEEETKAWAQAEACK